MRVIPELKMDADDQEEEFEKTRKEIQKSIDKLKWKRTRVRPDWPVSASAIAGDIASQFFQITSLFHADLRRMIADAIEEDRRIVLEQFNER